MHRALPLLALLATAACRDEPTVAEQFNELRADIENKGRTYDAEAENLVAEQERRLAEEANALLTQNANLFGNAAAPEVDVNSGEIEIDTR
ncbi:MAG TPA: hypothetical protein VEZ20_13870 [Allosphingosinicella sp.]|jgi:hypothetical protein|nr:hypothetical protein [Allosphingosinicella sp.]